MALTLPFAEATSVGSPALNIAIFAAFVVVTLAIVIRVSSGKKTAEQYYTAAGAFSGRQNGVAIAGDYLSAASFLGIAGAIALQGTTASCTRSASSSPGWSRSCSSPS